MRPGDTDMAMRDLIAMGAMIGRRMFVSGQGLSATTIPAPRSPADMKRVAEERVKAGDDWVKVFASGGRYDNVGESQTLALEEIKASLDATHALGKRIAVHSYGSSGARDAVRAGADSVEHAVDLDDGTLTEMAQRGIFYVPTIDHTRYYIDAKDEFGFPPGVEEPLTAFITRNLETAKRAHKAGVPIAMGSDAVLKLWHPPERPPHRADCHRITEPGLQVGWCALPSTPESEQKRPASSGDASAHPVLPIWLPSARKTLHLTRPAG